MAQIIIAAADQSGHRREYIALFRGLFDAAGVDSVTKPLSWKEMFGGGVLFSPMLEEFSVKFILVATLRALTGRRSVALLFRPTEAAHSSELKHRVKYFGLRLLHALPASSVLTILPFSIDPAFGRVAKDWIYDPQLWDLVENSEVSDPSLGADVVRAAAGRRLVISLGAQNDAKGFDYLAEIWTECPDIRRDMLFVAAGKVSAASEARAAQFAAEGGMLVNRFISDAELRGLYDAADLIWSCYAPFYDQASGIFGRAVQLGKPSIVRAGSQVARLADVLGQPTLPVLWNDADAALNSLLNAVVMPHAPPSEKIAALRSQSIAALERAFGLKFGARK